MLVLVYILVRFSVHDMTSKVRTRDKFLNPFSETEVLTAQITKTKRQATVYDAVAGEILLSIPHTYAHGVQVESLRRGLSQTIPS